MLIGYVFFRVEKTKPRRFAAPGLLFSPPSLNGLANVGWDITSVVLIFHYDFG